MNQNVFQIHVSRDSQFMFAVNHRTKSDMKRNEKKLSHIIVVDACRQIFLPFSRLNACCQILYLSIDYSPEKTRKFDSRHLQL